MTTELRSFWRICTLALLTTCFSLPVYPDGDEDLWEYETPDDTAYQEPSIPQSDLIDLEKSPQDFILDTKKIEIEECPESFNPSILRWNNSLLLCFRIRDHKSNTGYQMGLTFLNENFDPISKAYLIEMRLPPRSRLAKEQDPRLFCLNDQLYIIYSAMLDEPSEKEVRRVHIAEVNWDGKSFYVEKTQSIEEYPGERQSRWEKNWIPFIYEDDLLLAYSIVPHRILRPVLGTKKCLPAFSSIGLIQWSWGVLRGGTQALLVDGEYLSFFHSSTNMASMHSKGKVLQHYFMGAYTFSASPPFEITRISKEPIVGKNFYNGPLHKTWKPLQVVFPGGFVFDDRFVWVVYGRQDHEIWVAKFDKKGLLNSLIPVNSVKQ